MLFIYLFRIVKFEGSFSVFCLFSISENRWIYVEFYFSLFIFLEVFYKVYVELVVLCGFRDL